MKYMMLLLFLSGCASTSREDAAVQLHGPTSTVIANCEKLGPVSIFSLGWGDEENKLKKQARQQYNADAVVLNNRSMSLMGYTLQGTALRCFEKK